MSNLLFISHRNLDASLAEKVATVAKTAGLTVYLDLEDPKLKQARSPKDILKSVESGLKKSNYLVAILSPFSRNSNWVQYEIGTAKEMGLPTAVIVQNGVRVPEYIEDVDVLRSTNELVDWIEARGKSISLTGDVQQELDTWFESGIGNRSHYYRNAIDHLESLWRPNTWDALKLTDAKYVFSGRWIGVASEELIHILYSLISPMVALYPRVAGISETEQTILSSINKSFADDEDIAKLAPAQEYAARNCQSWKSLRENDPRKYWLQGLQSRDLDAARKDFVNDKGKLLSREQFAKLFIDLYDGGDGKKQKPLGLSANALQGFELKTRPIFARLAAAQIRMYQALLRIEMEGETRARKSGLFELPSNCILRGTEEESVSLEYLKNRVFPEISKATGIEVSEFA